MAISLDTIQAGEQLASAAESEDCKHFIGQLDLLLSTFSQTEGLSFSAEQENALFFKTHRIAKAAAPIKPASVSQNNSNSLFSDHVPPANASTTFNNVEKASDDQGQSLLPKR